MRFASCLINGQHVLVPESLSEPNTLRYYPISHFSSIPAQVVNTSFQPTSTLINHLIGRHLLLEEIPFSLQTLHDHYLNGHIQLEAGIQNMDGNLTCRRCGNNHLFSSYSCSRCGEYNCHYCRHCIMMGRVSSCSALYHAPTSFHPVNSSPLLEWNGTLSAGQIEASNAVATTIKQNNELLVWAVCGSGKTEVLFRGLEEALSCNQTICIATPRTDVVRELVPRLEKVFPVTPISALYSGSTSSSSRFIVSTTHQLLRYKQYFDVMIIDEVDAFPYTFDPALQYAVNKSRKRASSLIYLTATPSQFFLKRIDQQSLSVVRIPARFNGFPLPMPSFTWIGNWRKKMNKRQMAKPIVEWINKQISAEKPVLLFMPSITTLESAKALLEAVDIQCEAVHSEDPDRADKVLRFRRKEIPILLTTTILERGVPIENVSVGVVGAEDHVYTENALVQIAGRAGRSAEFPDGDVTFFHYGKTNAMVAAVRQIERMNDEAGEREWLKV
ncbi:DEAD/DEAH box helicase [Pseudalkalibacillus hwajinpoensis]|uniref:DEAD/DEAH box helicase n=1 Tax=Guptibacillus hwajinpoensis TaxID=208199 RepID=UPI00325C2B91